jgi:penicillin V acylase-like amidase (Ntn superfamily)
MKTKQKVHAPRPAAILSALLVGLLSVPHALACSRILWNNNNRAVIVGRNMDWFEDIRSNMWILPRGVERDGLAEKNPARWTSKYGSVVLTAYDVGVADGVNEKGLAAHMLYLPETSVGPRDESLPGLSMSLWVQYYLDQFATVDEAVKSFGESPYQLQMMVEPASGRASTVHIALNDATGDSAVIECIDGKIQIYHDRNHIVMTNQPSFDKQLENLRRFRGFGGDQRLPGTHEPADRFVRGAYYVKHLPEPQSDREAVAAMMSVMRNVSAPFGISDPERPNVSTTVWRTITDLTNRVLYYDSVFSPNVFWVDIKMINFDVGQPVRKLTLVDNFEHFGNVSGNFKEAEMFEFLRPD